MEIAGRVLDTYRPDLAADAQKHENPRHSARARVCQSIEDQQIQIMEEVLTDAHIKVGDIIYDALLVQRCDEELLSRTLRVGESRIKERLGLDATFRVEPWPELVETEDALETAEHNPNL